MKRAIASAILVSVSCFGTDYYVRTDGNDTNDGLSNNSGGAWLTIQKAANTIGAGDTAHVQSGTYAETVTINSGDGSAGNFKKFVGSGLPSVTKFNVQDAYCWIEGFYVTSTTADQTGIYLQGPADGTVVTNNTVEVRGIGIQVQGSVGNIPDDLVIVGNTVTNCNKGLTLYATAAQTQGVVRSNTIVRLHQWTAGSDCDYIRLLGGTNWIIQGNLSYGSTTNDIDTTTSSYPHVDGIQVYAESSMAPVAGLITGNVILDAMAGVQFTDTLALGHGNLTITNNVIGRGLPILYTGEMNGQAVVNMTAASGTVVFRNNTAYLMGSPATFLNCNSVLLTNNIFVDTSTGYSFTGTTPGAGGYNTTHPTPSPDAGTGDITSDPLFVDQSDILGPDGIPWTADDGLILTAASPAKAAASDGTSMGAYQYVASPALGGAATAVTATVGTLTQP